MLIFFSFCFPFLVFLHETSRDYIVSDRGKGGGTNLMDLMQPEVITIIGTLKIPLHWARTEANMNLSLFLKRYYGDGPRI